MTALLCAAAVLAAGCHNNNLTSGYGVAWVTLTDTPGDFTSYIVNVDSVTLTRSDGAVVTALATLETVDFTKLNNIAELWGSATVPVGTYTSASIVIDYTNAVISVMANGLPRQAQVVSTSGAAVTTQTVNVIFDPANPLVIPTTYATTSAQRLAFDFNLAVSTPFINLGTNPIGIQVRPWVTAAIAPADNKPIRVRGPLINSDVGLGAYTVYERPFHDAVNNLGSLTLFTDANTVFTTNGTVLQGAPGLTQLSKSSAGSTVTAAYTTFEPTATPTATAGKYTALYVVAGSTLEDVYTSGLEGDVVARTGNTLTLQGSTLTLNDGISTYNVANAEVLLGPATIVTADNRTLTNLNSTSVAVGQHIACRGIYSLSGTTVVLDATGSTTNTGSVRLIPTQIWGYLAATPAAGSALLNLQTINGWPAGDFNFGGNGASAATTPVAAAFAVDTGTLPVPDMTVGHALWIDGLVAPFGSAPPAFDATSVNDEASVQAAGQTAATAAAAPSSTNPTPNSCAQGNFDCVPASMRVSWSGTGTATPFSSLTANSLVIDLANPSYSAGSLRIGPEDIDLRSLPSSPLITSLPPPVPVVANTNSPGSITVTLPPVFLPKYSLGDPAVGIRVYSVFGTFATGLPTIMISHPALQFEARGVFDRTTNTFSALSIDLVL